MVLAVRSVKLNFCLVEHPLYMLIAMCSQQPDLVLLSKRAPAFVKGRLQIIPDK